MFENEMLGSEGQNAVIKVIGVGGGGGNAVERMLAENIEGVEFIIANTDAQVLRKTGAKTVLQLGEDITKGLGAGADPDIGRQSAEENLDTIKQTLAGSDMIFITAGMGGGTGTGAAPVIARAAKEMGILTVAIVTKPFTFEGKVRMQIADEGIKELCQHVDSLITIPNNKLLSVLGKSITLLNAFKAANNVLLGAVQGIAELITRPGLINVDFADVRTVMSQMGMAMMGTGVATGDNRAREAAEAAIASPLLDDVNLSGARGVLVNITAGMDLSIGEFEEVGETVKNFTSEGAAVVVGTVIDPDMRDEIRVTVVVTGLGQVISGNGKLASTSGRKVSISQSAPVDTKSVDYQQFEKPAIARRASQSHETISEPQIGSLTQVETQPATQAKPANAAKGQDMDYLDIPAFLRRKENTTEEV